VKVWMEIDQSYVYQDDYVRIPYPDVVQEDVCERELVKEGMCERSAENIGACPQPHFNLQ